MKQIDENQQAEAFYQRLREGDGAVPGAESPEERLAVRLQETIKAQPASPAFKEELGKAVEQIARARGERSGRQSSRQWMPFVRYSLYAGAAILLLIGLVWSIQNLLPNSPAAGLPVETTEAPATSTATPQASPEVEETTPPAAGIEMEAVTPEPILYTLPLLPGVEAVLGTSLPESPDQTVVFEQLDDEPLTPDNAREMAQRLGVEGTVYQTPAESPQQTVYTVSDGANTIIFVGTPYRFNYFRNTGDVHGPEFSSLTSEEKIAKAEAFLSSAGLLPETYRVDVPEAYTDQVQFQPTIGGAPLWIHALQAPVITVTLDAQGEVSGLAYERVVTRPAGEYPIRSAQEAWEKLLSDATWGVENIDSTPIEVPKIEWWSRLYPTGQDITLYNYLTVYNPVSAADGQRLTLGNYTLQGNTQGMVEANRPGVFYQAWGKLVDEFTFEVSGWQVSPFPDENLEGNLERRDGKAYLVSESGRYLLPELPAELADGAPVRIRGVRLDQSEPTFEWSYLETGEITGHGGGGGGGGSFFLQVTLAGDGGIENTPVVAPTPIVEMGAPIEAITGTLTLQKNRYPDGTLETITSVYLYNQQDAGLYELRLEGENLQGIDAYHTLPVRIWGTVTGQLPTGQPVVNVERYEPVYPGLKIEAWIGTWQVVHLEDKDVILFSAEDGSQFVLAGSLGFDPDEFIGYPGSRAITEDDGTEGSRVLLEGVRFPTKTYAGYPLVEERSAAIAEDGMTLDGYEITSDDVWVNEQAAQEGGRLTIERVELAYRANDMRFGPYAPSSGPLYVQPVWSFYGRYEDGRVIEIMVQALRDEYLQQQ
jgi:hypothetical protein